MKLVLASKNKKKLAEMNDILSHLGVEVCSEAEAGVDVEVEETGTTFAENALIKAETICRACGLPTIADDSGLWTRWTAHPACTAPATAATTAMTRPTTTSCWTP